MNARNTKGNTAYVVNLMNQNRKKMSDTVKKRGPKKKAKGEKKRHVQFYIKESVYKKYRKPENLLKPEVLAENE